VLLIIVTRSRLDRYVELRHDFGDWRDVRIVLDRREGDRRTPKVSSEALVDRRRGERRRPVNAKAYLKLGWDVVETDDSASRMP
jgi:hypothetical protein